MSPAAAFTALRRAGWRLDQIYPARSGRKWWALGIDADGRAISRSARSPEAALWRLVHACQRSADRTKPVGRRPPGPRKRFQVGAEPPPGGRSAADTF